MKRYQKIMLSLAAMALVAPTLRADTITTVGYGGFGPWQTNQGGEFTLLANDGTPNANLGYYDPHAKDLVQPGTFQTFCVEGREYIWGNNTSYTTVGDKTVYSDVTLTAGAAWLYWQFAGAGNSLVGYDYANSAAGRHASADLLQKAIWAFMGQESQTAGNNSSNPFFQLAITTLGEANATSFNNGVYPVEILNLWGDSTTQFAPQQDQLILTAPSGNYPGVYSSPVPDGGFTVALLGLSLTGLGVLRRRFQPAR